MGKNAWYTQPMYETACKVCVFVEVSHGSIEKKMINKTSVKTFNTPVSLVQASLQQIPGLERSVEDLAMEFCKCGMVAESDFQEISLFFFQSWRPRL